MAVDITTIGIAIDTQGLKAGQRELAATENAANKTADAADKTSGKFKALESSVSMLKGALAGLGLTAIASQYLKMADAVTLMDARLKLAVGSGQDFAQAQKDIYQIAQRNAVELGSVASLYTKLNDPIKAIGGSTAEVAAITEAFATSLKVSGASATEASSATLQFAQAMGAGALRGDEFNSIAEANPRFMKAVAQSLGVATGELRQMAQDGKLTADVVGGALIQSLGKLRQEGESIPLTVGAAMQQLSNDALVLVGSLDKVTGGSGNVADMMVRVLTPAMKGVYSVVVGVVTVFQTLGRIIGSVMGQVEAMFSGEFERARQIGKMAGEDIKKVWSDAGAAINSAWETTSNTASAANADASRLNRALGSAADKSKALAAAEREYAKIRKNDLSVGELRNKMAGENFQLEQKALGEAAARYADLLDSHKKETEAIQDQVKAQKQANEAYGLTGIALAQLEAARISDAAAEKERHAAIMDSIDPEIAKIYRDQAKSLKELAQARIGGAMQKEAVEAAKKTQDAWQQTAQKMEDMLTDALMRGFENGKSFGENLGDSIVNIFKTMVAREIAKAITQAILSALASTQWGSVIGSFLGGGQGGGIMGAANQASNLASVGGAAYQYMTGASVGTSSLGLAYANGVGAVGGDAIGALYTANGGWAGVSATGGGAVATGGGAMATTTGGAVATGGTTAATGGVMAGAQSVLSAIPVWGWVAIAAIALWKPLFGRKLKEVGTQLNFNQGGITANEYKFEKGGLFRSDKRTVGADITGQSSELIAMARNVQDGAAGMARAMGYSDEAIKAFTGSLNINFKGAESAEEQMKRVNDAMTQLQMQMFNAATGLNYTKEQFEQFIGQINEAMQKAGITAEGMTDIIVQGMLGRMSQAQVGEALSDMVIGGIYSTIVSPVAGQIAQAFQAQIIQPVFTAVLAGVPISQAISQQAIANVVATAQRAAATLNAIFADPGFRQAIAGIQQAIGGIAGAVGSVRVPAYKAAAVNFNTAARAAEDAAEAQRRAAEDAAEAQRRAAEEFKRAWQDVADSLTDEIRRIRGEILGDTAAGRSFYQAQFAMATAQARAGDQDAAKMLPELSRKVLEIAESTAGSLGDLRAVQGSTLASLTETRRILSQNYGLQIPQFAVGTNYVPQDMLAMIHKGEAIVPAKFNPANTGSDPQLAQQVGELKRLTAMMASSIDRLETGMARLTSGYNVMRNQEVTA